MLKLNAKLDNAWDVLLAVSFAGVLASAYFLFAAPKPKPNSLTAKKSELKNAEKGAKEAEKKAEDARTALASRTWTGEPSKFGPKLMNLLTDLGDRHHAQLSRFQAGHAIEGADLVQSPYVVTLEGAFPDVMSAIDELEATASKLAVGAIKIEPSNTPGAATAAVSATLNVTAFFVKPKETA